ncbi:PAB1 binding protein Pbp1 [Coccidioides posadasii str. Silveira]|uniref:PAB1 binding protein Pbp1 n=3 Tax=Coccidioides posadasii TaxID=199306 RepID=E9CRJ1_COCPS|nr:PAB1 binding protein Pbp1 [Coccidioides posadasii str. Silveira]KMM68140.1 hypothetical protein CPAG_04472 [Coccidioides posadasii RMSCC 3488]
MSQNTVGNRGPMRPNAAFKDGGRRQSGSPVDGGQRRNNNNTPRGWMQSANAITRKDTGPTSQQNGAGHGRKPAVSPKSLTNKESNTPDMHAHDRLVFLMTAFIGSTATITTKNGENFSGIFSGSRTEPNETSFVLKMTRRASTDPDSIRPNGTSHQASPYLGSGPDHKMIFDAQDVADFAVAGVSTAGMGVKEQNGSSFRTDTDISGNQPGRERELQRWEPGPDAVVEMSLEGSASTGTWDQFETNARLFGATSSYDENLYTTRIDRNDPSYKQREAEAARIAREIESSETDNPHVREERGFVNLKDDIGEEEKYSGVRRDDFPPLQTGGPNKYTPPARRPPMGHPTVPGAPVDPAIISAQVAQPKTAQPKPGPRETEAKQQDKQAESGKATGAKAADATKPADLPKPASTIELNDTEGKLTAVKPIPSLNIPPKRTGVENAATNVETEVLDHFRQFANNEKLKLQERRRNQAQYDRTIKLNELVKFSKNFKLGTPVPKDLVPILAKDPNKQEEIIQRAKKQHEEKLASEAAAKAAAAAAVAAAASTASSTATAEQKQTAPRQTGSTGPARYDTATAPSMPPPERQMYPRGRQGYPPLGPQSGRPVSHLPAHPGRAGSGLLSHRLADIQQQRKGAAMGSLPAPLPLQDTRVPPSGPMAGDHANAHKPTQTPTSAVSTKFNARAMEFRPNPAAHTFNPASTSAVSSSPVSNVRTRSISRAASPSAFFGAKVLLPATERPSLNDHFNPIKRMKKEATEQSLKDFAFNGGIPPAYKTPPTWEVASINQEKTYADMFKPPGGGPAISPQTRSASNPPMPHQAPLPFHLQHGNHNVPPSNGPPHGPHHLLPPQHHPAAQPHFEDHHRMQVSASASHAYPSPRLQHAHMPYQSPMGPHAQLAMGQGVPQFYVGQGPQPPHMRHYPGAPQFVNPQNGMGAPMMVHQPSSGPYMGMPQGMGPPYNPQMQMYSPSPGHAYPHVQPPPQPHSGYPSPSRGAPMMVHQGSQQGQPPQPVMVMNPGQHGQPFYPPQQPSHMPGARPGHPQQHPHFASSPSQAHHYPHHQYRTPSNNFNQMPHMPPPHMQSQGPPQGPASGPHPNEGAEEVK